MATALASQTSGSFVRGTGSQTRAYQGENGVTFSPSMSRDAIELRESGTEPPIESRAKLHVWNQGLTREADDVITIYRLILHRFRPN